MREWIGSTLAGIILVAVVACVGVTAWFSIQVHAIVTEHNNELAKITLLAKQDDKQAHQYLEEQNALAAAGKAQVAFAEWLIQSDASLCNAVHANCPQVPNFTSK